MLIQSRRKKIGLGRSPAAPEDLRQHRKAVEAAAAAAARPRPEPFPLTVDVVLDTPVWIEVNGKVLFSTNRNARRDAERWVGGEVVEVFEDEDQRLVYAVLADPGAHEHYTIEVEDVR